MASNRMIGRMMSSYMPRRHVGFTAGAVRRTSQTPPQSSQKAKLERLRDSIAFETSKGLRNFKGKIVFSEFATSELRWLVAHSVSDHDKMNFDQLLKGFEAYERMSQGDRKTLVNLAKAVLARGSHKPPASFVSTVGSAMLQDRIASNSQASTSSQNSNSLGGRPVDERSTTVPTENQPHYLSDRPDAERTEFSYTGNTDLLKAVLDGPQVADVPLQNTPAEELVRQVQASGTAELMGKGNGISTEVFDAAYSKMEDTASKEARDLVSETAKDKLETALTTPADQLRVAFHQAAINHDRMLSELRLLRETDFNNGEQRNAEWHAVRDNRLTASAFGNALGFWPGGRAKLWEEKLGLAEKFAGNSATVWGTNVEPEALERYMEVTGHIVESKSFQVYGDSLVTAWLGASPDGLIPTSDAQDMEYTGLEQPSAYKAPPRGLGPGVLEIKCPHNKGKPQTAKPYASAPFYYMPQVQGLMQIFDREWCNLFSYTVNGSALYHVKRDRNYWNDCYIVLADFWWESLIPAKHTIKKGDREIAEAYRPSEKHLLTDKIVMQSKRMTENAKTILYPPRKDLMNTVARR